MSEQKLREMIKELAEIKGVSYNIALYIIQAAIANFPETIKGANNE